MSANKIAGIANKLKALKLTDRELRGRQRELKRRLIKLAYSNPQQGLRGAETGAGSQPTHFQVGDCVWVKNHIKYVRYRKANIANRAGQVTNTYPNQIKFTTFNRHNT